MAEHTYRLVVLSEKDGTAQEISFGIGLQRLLIAATVAAAIAISVALLFFGSYLGTVRASRLASAHIAQLHRLVAAEQQQKSSYLADQESVSAIAAKLSTLEQAVSAAESRVSAIDGYSTPALAGFQSLVSALEQLSGQLNAGAGPAQAVSWPGGLPVAGRVSATYGWQGTSGTSHFNSGILITAPLGATVSAVAAGTVHAVQPSPQGGDTILIDSAAGLQISYSQVVDPRVAAGQTVHSGTALGKAGQAPVGFAIWVWGVAENPLLVIHGSPLASGL